MQIRCFCEFLDRVEDLGAAPIAVKCIGDISQG